MIVHSRNSSPRPRGSSQRTAHGVRIASPSRSREHSLLAELGTCGSICDLRRRRRRVLGLMRSTLSPSSTTQSISYVRHPPSFAATSRLQVTMSQPLHILVRQNVQAESLSLQIPYWCKRHLLRCHLVPHQRHSSRAPPLYKSSPFRRERPLAT